MRLLVPAVLMAALSCAAQEQAGPRPESDLLGRPQETTTPNKLMLTVPAGAKVVIALTSPVWAKSAQPGDTVYAVTAFPVTVNNTMAIPPGTYMEGEIDTMTRPSRKLSRAEFQMHFTKMIFANGYIVGLPLAPEKALGSGSQHVTSKDPILQEVPVVRGTANATVHVEVSPESDILLDNGSQIEIVLQTALSLDAERLADAVRQSRAPQIQWPSATRCRPIPGTPGTEPTVMPGTPGTPGTPDTVIPGGSGMPDTVIPGIPATPGTPPTVIGGSSGTPGVPCPGPPAVISELGDVHKESFKIAESVSVAGKRLSAGSYQVAWEGPGPDAQVRFIQNGQLIATVRARVVTLAKESPKSAVDTGSDGSPSLRSIQFKGKIFALSFEQSGAQNIPHGEMKAIDPTQ
jgi:hypothetical protein